MSLWTLIQRNIYFLIVVVIRSEPYRIVPATVLFGAQSSYLLKMAHNLKQ
jgi:hypothetical protein